MENLENLKKLQERLNKKFGANSVVTMATFKEVPKLSSGILGVDRILGGGWAKGRIIEVAGPESSGKTTLVLETIANFHKNNPEGFAFYCDAESAFDPSYAKSLGIDMDRLLLNQPQSAEEGYDLIKEIAQDEIMKDGIIVLDSCNAMSPQAEMDKDMSSSNMGLTARLLSSFLRQITSIVSKNGITFFIISQIRLKIGVIMGNPEVKGVGNALKFYNSQSVDIRKTKTNENGDEAISNTVRIKVCKNKVAPPFKKGEFTINFGKGFDKVSDIANLAKKLNIVEASGAWVKYGDKKWNGMAKFLVDFENDNSLKEEIIDKVKSLLYNSDLEDEKMTEEEIEEINKLESEETES